MTQKKAIIIYHAINSALAFVLFVGNDADAEAYKTALLAMDDESDATLGALLGGAGNYQVIKVSLMHPVEPGEKVSKVGDLYTPAEE